MFDATPCLLGRAWSVPLTEGVCFKSPNKTSVTTSCSFECDETSERASEEHRDVSRADRAATRDEEHSGSAILYCVGVARIAW